MTLPDKAEVVRRFDDADRRLETALAFARLFAELHDEQDTHQLFEEVRKSLADLQEERRDLDRFAGRKALRGVRKAEIDCAVLLQRLADRDRALSPTVLRQRLRSGRASDTHDLVSLLGFYVQLEGGPRWNADRVDKVDLLITELSRRLTDARSEPASERLWAALAAYYPTTPAAITDLESRTFERNLATIQAEVESADSLSQLIDSGTLDRYRSLKRRLGHLLLHPDLLAAVIRTNQCLHRKIERLNSRTLTGIFSIYQGIFETALKGRLEPELRREIDQLHLDFDRFETRVKQDELRLTELEGFWTDLQDLAARLQEAAPSEPESPAAPDGPTGLRIGGDDEPAADWLAEDLEALLDMLRESDRKRWPAEFVTLSPDEEFQLDPREVVAFRRLSGGEAVDRPLEMFLLKAAALRRSIKRSARKLAGTSDTGVSRELPVFAVATQAVQLAEGFLGRYSQAVGQAILDGDAAEAQKLQVLRMRLVRESAGIWLQVHQPI